MRSFIVTLIALVVGFIAGMAMSEMIGIVGFVLLHRAIGIRSLPVYVAIAFIVIANLIDRLARHKSRKTGQ
jgi:putative Ca2+/H+ antiporter (TMEM165/GDT1 family)